MLNNPYSTLQVGGGKRRREFIALARPAIVNPIVQGLIGDRIPLPTPDPAMDHWRHW